MFTTKTLHIMHCILIPKKVSLSSPSSNNHTRSYPPFYDRVSQAMCLTRADRCAESNDICCHVFLQKLSQPRLKGSFRNLEDAGCYVVQPTELHIIVVIQLFNSHIIWFSVASLGFNSSFEWTHGPNTAQHQELFCWSTSSMTPLAMTGPVKFTNLKSKGGIPTRMLWRTITNKPTKRTKTWWICWLSWLQL